MDNVLCQELLHYFRLVCGGFVVSPREHCEYLRFSLVLGYLESVSVRHPGGKDFGKLIKTWVVAQEGTDLVQLSKFRAEVECRACLALEEPLKVVVDSSQEAGVMFGRIRRDIKPD